MLSMSDSASARMGLSKVQVRAARLDEAGGGGKGAARARPTAKRGLEKKEAALSSGPSLGRKRPRRAYAMETIARAQHNCATQHSQEKCQRDCYIGPNYFSGASRGALARLASTGLLGFLNEWGSQKKRRPPCRHSGPESREETPKEGICDRSYRTATIYLCDAALSSAKPFFLDRMVR